MTGGAPSELRSYTRTTRVTLPVVCPRYDLSPLTEDDLLWKLEREPRDESIARAQRALRWLWDRPVVGLAVQSDAALRSSLCLV